MTFWIVWKVTACDFAACRHDIKGICVMRGTLVLIFKSCLMHTGAIKWKVDARMTLGTTLIRPSVGPFSDGCLFPNSC